MHRLVLQGHHRDIVMLHDRHRVRSLQHTVQLVRLQIDDDPLEEFPDEDQTIGRFYIALIEAFKQVDPTLITLLTGTGYLPVLTPPAISDQGEAINVDGDKLALQLAIALQADALIILSNTAGLLKDVSDPASLITEIDVSSSESVESAMNSAAGRMKKKVQAGCDAVEAGIGKVVFANANTDHPVSSALNGSGTVLRASAGIGAGN
jgi:acetylglutamate kinase